MIDYPVTLVNTARKINQVQFPLWLSVLSNALRMQKIIPQIIDLIPAPIEQRDNILLSLLPDKPAIYGFNIIAGNGHLDETNRLAQLIHNERPGSIVVYGGPLPSAIPEMILDNCPCDFVVHGEGKVSFAALIGAIKRGNRPDEIDGIFYRDKDKIVGVRRKLARRLDDLSNPSFADIDMDFYIGYLKETGQSWEIMASRGCWADCSFCYKFMGNGMSLRSPGAVLDEIETMIHDYGMDRFYFVDENFLQIKKFFRQFIKEKNQRDISFTFVAQSRIDTIDEETLRLAARNGLVYISTGVESPSEETLKRMGKMLTLGQIENGLAIMRQYNIRPSINLVIGFPWETEADYQDIMSFIKRNKLQGLIKLHYLTPLPATRLFTETMDRGLIDNEYEYIRSLGDLYWERKINLTSLSDDTLDYYYRKISEVGKRKPKEPVSSSYSSQIRKVH